MTTSNGTIHNMDNFKGIEPLLENRLCLYRALLLEKAYGLTAEGGTMLAWSKKTKKWMFVYDFHYWVVDDQGNLYDSVTSLNDLPNTDFFKYKKTSTLKYLMLDYRDFSDLKLNPKSWDSTVEKWASKYIDKDKYDFIYLYGVAMVDGKQVYEDDLYEHLYGGHVIEHTTLTNDLYEKFLVESE